MAFAGRNPDRSGKSVTRGVYGGELLPPARMAAVIDPKMTFDEMLAPVRGSLQDNGMSDEEIDGLSTEALQRVQRQKRRQLGAGVVATNRDVAGLG